MQSEGVKPPSHACISAKERARSRSIAANWPTISPPPSCSSSLNTLSVAEQYDIKLNLVGGGFKGQSEAARLAITRALIKINPESKPALKAEGFVTRDPREVERKKPGRPKARKRFQFSKR